MGPTSLLLSCKKAPIMRILRSWLVIPWLAFLVLSSAQPPHEESTAASRIDQIMQARYAAVDFNGTVLVARQVKSFTSAGSDLRIENGTS
jgi:hypothetical protein